MKKKETFWYRLDNAATIFPALRTAGHTDSFRLSCVLDQPIKPEILDQAIKLTLPRFSCFNVQMRIGLFWYYLEQNTNPPPTARHDINNPCLRFKLNENNGYLLRIYYYNNKISVEFFHSLTDGSGGLIFLNTLVACYLRLSGYDIPYDCVGTLNINDPTQPEECEDAFKKYATSKANYSLKNTRAYRPRATPLPKHRNRIITGIMSSSEIYKLAKSYDVTITEFLTAILMDIYIKRQKQETKKQMPVRISLPINLRNTFPSQTLRNFSLYLRPQIDGNLGDYSIEELCYSIKHQLALMKDKKVLNAHMTENVALENTVFVRRTPLFIKNFVLNATYKNVGVKPFATSLSNLGRVNVDKSLADHIKRYDFILRPSITPCLFAVATIGDTMSVTTSSNMIETQIQRMFFTSLVKMGIKVDIESNF